MESHAGRVEGELNLRLPTDLRALYHVPFKARDAAKNPEAVKVLNDCCAEWVQSVDKGKQEMFWIFPPWPQDPAEAKRYLKEDIEVQL